MADLTTQLQKNAVGAQGPTVEPHQPHPVIKLPDAPEQSKNTQQERQVDQRIEQMLYSGEWGPAITAAVVKTLSHSSSSHRRTQQEVQQQDDSQGQAAARKKKRSSSSNVDDELVQRLVTVLGPDAAERVVAAIDKFTKQMNGSAGMSPDQLSQLTKDLAQALGGDGAAQVLGLSPQQVENMAQNGEISIAKVVNLVQSVVREADQIRVDSQRTPAADVNAILDAVANSTNAEMSREAAIKLLSSEQGIVALQDRLSSIENAEARIVAIETLAQFIGNSDFEAFAKSYRLVTGEPIAFTVRRPATQSIILTAEQESRLKTSLPALDVAYHKATAAINEFAAHAAVLHRERTRLNQQLPVQLIQENAAEQRLAAALGRQVEVGAKYEDSAILADLSKLYPGLDGKNLSEAYAILKASENKPDDEIGRIIEQLRGAGQQQGFVDQEAINAYRESLVRRLPVLNEVCEARRNVATTQERLAFGLQKEEAKLKGQLLLVTKIDDARLQREFNISERIKDAEIRLGNLEATILSAKSSKEVTREIEIRDQVEWEVAQKRIEGMLSAEDPDPTAVLGELDRYVTAYPAGVEARSLKYREQAIKLYKRFEAVEQLVGGAKGAGDLLKARADELQSELAGVRGDLLLQRAIARDWTFYRGDENIKAEKEVLKITSETIPQLDSALAVSRTLENATTQSFGADVKRVRKDLLRQAFSGKPLAGTLPVLNVDALPSIPQKDRKLSPYHELVTDLRQKVIDSHKSALEVYNQNLASEQSAERPSGFIVSSHPTGRTAQLSSSTRELVSATLKDLREDSSSHSSAETLHSLRALTADDPRFKEIFDRIPSNLSPSQQAQQLITALGMRGATAHDDLLRVQIFLSSQGKSSSLSGLYGLPAIANEKDAWKALTQVNGETLGAIVRTGAPLAALARIQDRLENLTVEQRIDFHRHFRESTGMTLGRAILQMRNSVDDHSLVLVKIAGMPDVSNDDLREFFPASTEISTNVAYRQHQLLELVRADMAHKEEFDKKVFESGRALAHEQTVLSLADDTSASEHDVASLTQIHARREEFHSGQERAAIELCTGLDPSFRARNRVDMHLREVRDAHVQYQQSITLGKFSELSARLGEGVANAEKDSLASVSLLRQSQLTESESLLVKALYGQSARFKTNEVVSSTSMLLEKDLNTALSKNKDTRGIRPLIVADLVHGGGVALRRFDVGLLSDGIFLQNSGAAAIAIRGLSEGVEHSKTVRARIAEVDPALLPRLDLYLKSSAGRESQSYLQAVDKKDTVTREAIHLRHSGLMARGNTAETVDAFFAIREKYTNEELARLKGVWKELYGKEVFHEFGDSFTHVRYAWGSLLSKKPEDDMWSAYYLAGHALRFSDERKHEELFRYIERLSVDKSKLLEKCNSHAGEKDFLSLLRNTEGEYANERATLAKRYFSGLPVDTVVDVYRQFNSAEIDSRKLRGLLTERNEIFLETQRNFENLCSNVHGAQKVYDSQYFGSTTALQILKAQKAFQEGQRSLVRQQHNGIDNLRGTLSAQQAYVRAFTKDIEAKGSSSIALEERSQDLYRHAITLDQTIEWVSMRKQDYNAWRAAMGDKEIQLKWINQRVTVGVAVAKVAVVVSVSVFASPAAGLAVSLSLNVADKGVRLAVGAIDEETAMRELLIEGAIDIVLYGGFSAASKLLPVRAATGFTSVTVKTADDVVYSAKVLGSVPKDKLISGIARANEFGMSTVDDIAKQLGTSKKIAEAFKELSEKAFTNPDNVSQFITYSIKQHVARVTIPKFGFALGDFAYRAGQEPTPPAAKRIAPPVSTQAPFEPPKVVVTPVEPQLPVPPPAIAPILSPTTPAVPEPVAQQPIVPTPPVVTIDPPFVQPVAPIEPPTLPVALVQPTTPEPVITPPTPEPPIPSTVAAQNPPEPQEPLEVVAQPPPEPQEHPAVVAQTPPEPQEPPAVEPQTPPESPKFVASMPEYPGAFDWDAYNKGINDSFNRRIQALIDALCSTTPYIPPPPPPATPPVPPPTFAEAPRKKSGDDPFAPPSGSSMGPVFDQRSEKTGNSYTYNLAKEDQASAIQRSDAVSQAQPQQSILANDQRHALDLYDQMQNGERIALQQKADMGLAQQAAESVKITLAQSVMAAEQQQLAVQQAQAGAHREAMVAQNTESLRTTESNRQIVTAATMPEEAIRVPSQPSRAFNRSANRAAETLFTSVALNGAKDIVSDPDSSQGLDPSVPQQLRKSGSSIVLQNANGSKVAQGSVQEPFRNSQQQEFAARAIALAEENAVSNQSHSSQTNLTDLHTPSSDSKRMTAERVAQTESLRQIYEQIELHRSESHEVAMEEKALVTAAIEDIDDGAAARARARDARQRKQAKADERLREFILHELQTRQFLAAERDKLLALLRRLGITEDEYRALVAQLGELEAQRKMQGLDGYQNPLAMEVEESHRPEAAVALAKSEENSRAAAAESATRSSKDSTLGKNIARSELFAKLTREARGKSAERVEDSKN